MGTSLFKIERRGAEVTATDIKSYLEWDFVGGEREREKRNDEIVYINLPKTPH